MGKFSRKKFNQLAKMFTFQRNKKKSTPKPKSLNQHNLLQDQSDDDEAEPKCSKK